MTLAKGPHSSQDNPAVKEFVTRSSAIALILKGVIIYKQPFIVIWFWSVSKLSLLNVYVIDFIWFEFYFDLVLYRLHVYLKVDTFEVCNTIFLI